ncbi:hypothetical protein FSP39_001908 [Pinctada imbricata]|uniref:DZIP3-like HEPN domain-containing protein n=1 Tax=Pinctada imbricata TaxID=66713 RepID=A0AA88XDE7_PINIB|nr:hypothetical protein FSP39_001908 [Pinctada imbricata]
MALTAKTERDNFSRFGQGIVGTASTMTRDLLASYISPTDLVMKVRPGHPVWSSLDKLQKSLVQNAVMDGFLKFDISLSYKLIRNVCTNLRDPLKADLPAPSKGWGIDPQPSDVTPSDDLERIRILRNSVYGHVSQSSMPESEYQKHWQLLKDIASRMDTLLGKSYLNELQELELYKLSDAQVKDILKEITGFRFCSLFSFIEMPKNLIMIVSFPMIE